MASGSFLEVALELGTVLVNPEPRVGGVRVGWGDEYQEIPHPQATCSTQNQMRVKKGIGMQHLFNIVFAVTILNHT